MGEAAEVRCVTPAIGAVPDGVDASRRKGLGGRVFTVIKFAQETQPVALPHQMGALQSGVPESTLELLPHGIKALLDHDGESQHVPVIASTNYRHLVGRIAE